MKTNLFILITAIALISSCNTNLEKVKELPISSEKTELEEVNVNEARLKAIKAEKRDTPFNQIQNTYSTPELLNFGGIEWSIYCYAGENEYDLSNFMDARIAFGHKSGFNAENKKFAQVLTNSQNKSLELELSNRSRLSIKNLTSEEINYTYIQSLKIHNDVFLIFQTSESNLNGQNTMLVLKYEKDSEITQPEWLEKYSNRSFSIKNKAKYEPNLQTIFEYKKDQISNSEIIKHKTKKVIKKVWNSIKSIGEGSNGYEDGTTKRKRQRGLNRDKY